MKLTLKKLNEEKFEIKIMDRQYQIFHNELNFLYMGHEVFNLEKSLDMIEQLKTLFNGITVIENDFDI